jgi:hypothetical protein
LQIDHAKRARPGRASRCDYAALDVFLDLATSKPAKQRSFPAQNAWESPRLLDLRKRELLETSKVRHSGEGRDDRF